jgi:hypothetical protein
VELPERRSVGSSRGRRPCPPHGPHVVDVVEVGSYVAHCLVCGLVGPVCNDALEAKLAFEQTWR